MEKVDYDARLHAVYAAGRIGAALPALGDGPQYETSELLVFQR
jgi:hypothetical protein